MSVLIFSATIYEIGVDAEVMPIPALVIHLIYKDHWPFGASKLTR